MNSGEIKELIQNIAHKHGSGQFQVQSGVVKSVDWGKRTCVVTVDEEYDVPDVRLRSLNDGNAYGYCFKPTVNSPVLIAIIYNKPLNAYVCMFSQLDNISLVDSNGTEIFSVDIANGSFVFNGGNNGGLVIVGNAVKKFNAIEKDLNTVKTAFKTVLSTPINTGVPGNPDPVQAALNLALAAWDSQQLNITAVNDLANNKVKQ